MLTFDSALTVVVLVASSLAQIRPAVSQIFESPDGAFQFRFPESSVLCQPQYEQPTRDSVQVSDRAGPQLTGWVPESCSAYMDICPMSVTTTSSGTLHPEVIACIAYPNSKFEGTNFGGAAFSVSEVADATTKTACLQFDELTTDPKKAHWQSIGGAKFRANSGAEAGLGHAMSEDVYLTFHNAKCYDVEIRMTASGIANYEPGTIKEFKDYDKVSREMKRILDSFQFLK